MTLQQRNSTIDRTVSKVRQALPTLNTVALLQVASAQLARDYGLVVTPDEIVRVLSALAEPVT